MMDPTTAITTVGTAAVLGKPLVDKLAYLAECVFGPIADEVGVGLGEIGKRFKIKNQVETLELVQSIAAERGLTIEPLDPSFVVEWADSVATVSDSHLRELWAMLLVAASEGDAVEHRRYLYSLKQLTPADASLLSHCINYPSSIKLPRDDCTSCLDASVANLYRLGLLEPLYVKCGQKAENFEEGCLTTKDLRLGVSQFAEHFARAVGIRDTINQT